MLDRAVKKKKDNILVKKSRIVQAVDVLYDLMVEHQVKFKKSMAELLVFIQKDDSYDHQYKGETVRKVDIHEVAKLIREARDVVVDCATKLAPYQTPKLETLEVKSKVEHRYVIKAPLQIKSVDDWAKMTGAQQLKQEEQRKELVARQEIPPSDQDIHDWTEEDAQRYYNKQYDS